ncbi:MAG: ATP-binding cassette domain-containing protein [Bauldia sp.]|nr:ATP-binding cassette domain-containing protein [Bauldia sp.]
MSSTVLAFDRVTNLRGDRTAEAGVLAGERSAARVGEAIRFEGVRKSFGDREVLRTLDLDIPAGQLVAIVGRSGGGKTTLLRLVSGLALPSHGRVLVGGREVNGLQPSVRLLFQDSRLLPWQRVIRNVGIQRRPNWRETAEEALAHVGLADRARDWPAVLSGGQKQRVALARALVSHPRVLLLDEPFAALDALTRTEMHELFSRIWQEHGFTTILITHDVAEAVALADRVLVLRDGQIALDIPIDLPRPRQSVGSAEAARLQAHILGKV